MSIRAELDLSKGDYAVLATQEANVARPFRPFQAKGWAEVAHSLADYGITFHGLFSNQLSETDADNSIEFLDFLQKFSPEGRHQPYVLDVFADETVVRELVDEYGFGGGVAVSLGYSPLSIADKPEYQRTRLVNGDVLKRSSWRRLNDTMRELDIPNFDLILSRGIGALDYLPRNPRIQLYLLGQLWRRLNPNGGTMFLQLPKSSGIYVETWVNKAKEEGYDVDFAIGYHQGLGKPVIKMRRQLQNPVQLPQIRILPQ